MAAGILDLDILVDEGNWAAALPAVDGHCRRAGKAAFDRVWCSARSAEATLVLADDARVAELNRVFRGIDAPTNVLSFPQVNGSGGCGAFEDQVDDNGPPVALGDIIVAYETTETEARRDGKALADHLSHLVVHGILHLLGYDHQTDCEIVRMESLETSVLAELGVADPYAGLCNS